MGSGRAVVNVASENVGTVIRTDKDSNVGKAKRMILNSIAQASAILPMWLAPDYLRVLIIGCSTTIRNGFQFHIERNNQTIRSKTPTKSL
jgi:hypothetical protein